MIMPIKRQSAGRKKPATRADRIYQLKITLEDVQPPPWRRVLAPGLVNLRFLHEVIMWCFNWTDTHLHQFDIGGKYYGEPDPDESDEPCEDELEYRLMDVAGKSGMVFHHEYDFGDGWRHRIEVEAVAPPDERYPGHPVCIAGERSGPPEDCGGAPGYKELLGTLADPKHPDHKRMMKWVGGGWDPEAVDLDDINAVLKDAWDDAYG